MANYVYIATSIDGYIADKNGSVKWLNDIPNPDDSDFGFSDFMKRIDAIIMGRNTFETVLSFDEWPYTKKVFVLSNSLTDIPEKLQDKAEIISGSPKSVINDLQKKAYKNFYIDGGKVIQSFLLEDLIDEMIITRVPVILGGGISLFGKLEKPLQFKKVKSELINEYLIKNYFMKE